MSEQAHTIEGGSGTGGGSANAPSDDVAVKMEMKQEPLAADSAPPSHQTTATTTTTAATTNPQQQPPSPSPHPTPPPVAAPTAGASGVSAPGSSARTVIEQNLRMNQYFKTHGLQHSDTRHKQYHDFCRANPGQEPPISMFNTPTLTSSSASASPSSSSASTTASSSSSTSSSSTGVVAGSKNVEMVRTICRLSYVLTHDERMIRQNRAVEVQQIVNSLKSGTSTMSVLQANLMYQPDRQPHPLSVQQQQQMRAQQGAAAHPQGSSPQQLSAPSPGGAPYDPRRQSGVMPGGMAMAAPGSSSSANAQQRGGAPPKRKDAPGMGGPMSGYPMAPAPGMGGAGPAMGGLKSQPSKYRKEHQETSAAEMRTHKALELQAANFGTTLASPPMVSPSYAHLATATNMPPSSSSSSHQSSRARPPAPAQSVHPHPTQPVVATAFSMPSPNFSMNGRAPPPPVQTSLQTLWKQNKSAQADAHHLFLDAPALIQKVTTIASEHGLHLQQNESGLSLVELLTLATEGFLKNTLQSARYVSRRRLDLAKAHLPFTVSSDPRKELDDIRRQADESKLRWAKHRELAEGDAKRKAAAAAAAASAGKELEQKNAEAAALEAKHAAAVAEAERQARAAASSGAAGGATGGAAQSPAVEDDYILSLIGGGLGGATNGTSSSTASTTAAAASSATSSAPSFLPPSSLPSAAPRSFLPSSSLPSSGTTSAASTAPTIILADLLTVMESHPQLRKSGRLYQSYMLVGKKKADPPPAPSLQAPAREPSPPPPPPPPPPPTVSPSPPPQPSLQQPSYNRSDGISPPPAPAVSEFWNASAVPSPPAPFVTPVNTVTTDALTALLTSFGAYGLPAGLAPMPRTG